MPKLKVTLGIGYSNANQYDTLDIDDDEWLACETDEDREKLIEEYATEWAWNHIDIGAELVEIKKRHYAWR